MHQKLAYSSFVQGGLRRQLTGLLLFVCAVIALSFSPIWAVGDHLIDVKQITIGDDGQIGLKANTSLENYALHSSLKLMGPYRLVVDLPNAHLTDGAKRLLAGKPAATIPIANHPDLVELQLQQAESLFYQSVRLTVVAKNYDALTRLSFAPDGNHANITLAPKPPSVSGRANLPKQPLSQTPSPNTNALPPQPVATVPAVSATSMGPVTPQPLVTAPAHMAVVTAAHYHGGAYHLTTEGQRPPLQLRKRFTLSNPSRLVMDFGPGKLAHRGLSASTSIGDNPATHVIRLGQFDNNTVRVVLETTTPERYKAYFSRNQATNLQHVVITDKPTVNPAQSPSLANVTTIQQIGLDPTPLGGAVIRLKTRQPLVHRWFQDDKHLVVQLLNVAAEPGSVAFDNQRFPMIQQMAVTAPLLGPQPVGAPATQQSSQLVVSLAQKDGWRINTTVADDGHTFVLTIDPDIIALPPGQKIPFKATVVVDAGHGGKDQGASRAGVLEKHLTLSIAHKLRAALIARGVTVHMTRTRDTFLPLSTITAISNRHRPDAFVSVHINASVNPAIQGIETYYYHRRSIPLAKTVHRQLVATQHRPDRGTRKARFYVINHTPHPAILCEVGYISNTEERKKLTSPQSHSQIASAIADGVVAYLIQSHR